MISKPNIYVSDFVLKYLIELSEIAPLEFKA